MGLGKTIQVLGLLLHWRAEDPSAPPALPVLRHPSPANWLDAAFTPSLISGRSSLRGEEPIALPKVDVVLTTYGMVSSWTGLSA
jgi:SNF2 family DNA or RNA helicase